MLLEKTDDFKCICTNAYKQSMDFHLLWPTTSTTLFQPFGTSCNKLVQDQVAGKLASLTLLLLLRQLSAQSTSVFPQMKLNAFVHYRIRSSLNYLMYSSLTKHVCSLLKISFHACYAVCCYFIFLNPVVYNFLVPNRHFTLKMDCLWRFHSFLTSEILLYLLKTSDLVGWSASVL
jgi:hypothetical protein